MASTAHSTTKTAPAYPAADVAAVLQGELLTAMRRRYKRKGIPLPKDDAEVVTKTIEIDSLTVVDLLASLDDILPFKVTECVVKPGGYNSIDAAVKHVTGRVEKKWNEHHAGAKV
jgi:hypothetical protein